MSMNSSILLVEDRPQRMRLRLGEFATVLESSVVFRTEFPDIEDVEKYDFRKLDAFRLIAVHYSYFSDVLYNKFLQYVKISKSFFIVFSGGISQMSFNGNHFVKLPVQDFYQPSVLKRFIAFDGGEYSLLNIIYGENWKLPLYQQLRLLRWQYGETPEDPILLERMENLFKALGKPNKIDEDIHNIYLHY